ncbi:hypothetical protein ACOTWR_06140 [Aliarcobacter butzleri]
MIKKYLLLISVLISTSCFGATEIENKQNNFRNDHPKQPAVVTKTYKDATNSTSTKEWNNKDWQKQMEQNGVFDTGLIGNTQTNTSSKGSEMIYNVNPNELSTQNLRENEALKDNKALQGYSQDVEKSILDGNNKRATSKINLVQTTKCYIAREMPIRFRCSKTGLIYGSGINSGGADAQKLCETECYQQFSCINVSPPTNGPTVITIADANLSSNQKSITLEKGITNGLKIDMISFDSNITKEKVFMDLILIDAKDEEKIINRKILLKTKSNTFKVNQYGKSIKIVVYGDTTTSEAQLTNILITSKKDDKFICPTNQDISAKLPGNFAYLCPSGKIRTFTTETGTYKICEDYGVVGDNSDGTFSSESACNNSCRDSYSCVIDNTALSSSSLQNFREGCIEGQSDCTLETCRNLRLAKSQVLNENVFHGNFEPISTVVNGALVKGAERPKVLLSEDLSFEERSKEEWKDGAYNDMVNRGSYRVSASKINEDTKESSAYNIGMKTNSINGTDTGNAIKSLYWVFKPKAFDVSNKSYKFYAVLEVLVDNLRVDSYGKQYREKDKILYVKTSEGDYFKPIAIKRAYSKKTSNQLEDSEILTSVWEYQYFNTSSNNWFGHSSTTNLEYFKNNKIVLDGPFLRIPIVENYNGLMYQLPGLIRRIVKSGPNQASYYNGNFDGTGQAITGIKLYVDYSLDSNLTYQDVVTKIDNGEWLEVYNNTTNSAYPTAVISDTQITSDSVKYHNTSSRNSKEDIEIFLYGTENNKTAYTRIKPKTEDVGKKGFIYIFAQ